MRAAAFKVCPAHARAAALVSATGLLCLTVACAPHARVICEPLEDVYAGRLDRAVAAMDGTALAGSERDAFLYHAQRGHLLHLAGAYTESNAEFERAVAISKSLDPLSVTETITDYALNETVKPYPGEDYERAYLHYYMLLNYLSLDDRQAALVEARRLDEVFRNLDARYDEGRYQDDGFIRYLSGLLRESMGDLDEALVDYRLAYRAYAGTDVDFTRPRPSHSAVTEDSAAVGWPGALGGLPAPSGLIASLRSGSAARGAEEVPAGLPATGAIATTRGRTEIVVLIERGWAPFKVEESIQVPIHRELVPDDLRGATDLAAYVKIACPKLVSVPSGLDGFRVRVIAEGDSGRAFHAGAERVQDMDAIARAALERRIGAVTLRSTLRATAKQIALMKGKHELEERRGRDDDGEEDRGFWGWLGSLLGWIAEDVATIAVAESEQADTRSWVLLPEDIWMARIPVEAGSYEVRIDAGGATPALPLGTARVEEGAKAFLDCRVFGRPHPMRCDHR